MSIDTTQVKPGDRVGVARAGSWSNRYYVHTVKQVTKTGQVTIDNGDRFTSSGRLMGGSSVRSTWLISVEDAEAKIATEQSRKEMNQRCTRVVDLVTRTINSHKNGFGDYFGVTAEERDAMIAAISGLPIITAESI